MFIAALVTLFMVGCATLANLNGRTPGRAAVTIASVPIPAPLALSDSPSDAELFSRGGLREPLVATGKATSPEENRALALALTRYHEHRKQGQADRVTALEEFLKAYPDSAWTASLRVNLGLIYHQTGHFSKALSSFEQAWELTKSATEPKAKALGDRALGELAISLAYLGRMKDLEPLLEEVKDRSVDGSAREMLTSAAEGLHNMRVRPGTSFRCGPLALDRISQAHTEYGSKPHQVAARSRSTQRGLSLVQVCKLSGQAGMNFQMAYREPGSKVLLPCVTHWKVGHYAALVKEVGQRYLVEDPTYGASGESIHISPATLDEEASGYFLVPPGKLPAGWRSVSATEGKKVWGCGDTARIRTPTPPDPMMKRRFRTTIATVRRAARWTMEAFLRALATNWLHFAGFTASRIRRASSVTGSGLKETEALVDISGMN